jgi:hypothetical protein
LWILFSIGGTNGYMLRTRNLPRLSYTDWGRLT